MKKIAILATMIASAFVLASCASKATSSDQVSAASMSSTQTVAAPVCKHHHCKKHHDYKGETK